MRNGRIIEIWVGAGLASPIGEEGGPFWDALTRRAWNAEAGRSGQPDHESMEWLGDRILGAVVATDLWSRFPHQPPGRLDRARDALTSESPLAEIARELSLIEWIRMGVGERQEGQVTSGRALSAHVEALVAAAFLLGGWPAASAFVLGLLGHRRVEELPAADERLQGRFGSDAKIALNERVQKRWKRSILATEWRVDRVGGPDNAPVHLAVVTLPDGSVHEGGPVEGSKQAAMAAAATRALVHLDGQE